MPLVARSGLKSHTIRAFRAAALARYREGQILIASGCRLSGIYLLGYTGETLLKAAYFRFVGYGLNQAITLADMHAARNYATKILKCPWHGNLHDLRGWQSLLTEARKARALPYSPSFSRSFNAFVTRLALNWWEGLRYHAMQPYRGEAGICLRAVTWLVSQYHDL
jgi:hypothetical protein